MDTLFYFTVIAGILVYLIVSKYYNRKRIVRLNKNINMLQKNIINLIEERKDCPYYENIDFHEREFKSKFYSKKEINFLKGYIEELDIYYIFLNKSFRLLDNFNYYVKNFSKRKNKFRYIHKKSKEILYYIKDEYGEDNVKPHLYDFDADYEYYKIKDISKLNKYVKKGKKLYESFCTKELKVLYKELKDLDDNLEIILNEPQRLKDKIERADVNISQLESDIEQNKGSLYSKTLNIVKNNKIKVEHSKEWNKLKKRINNYRKNKALNNDIIKLSSELNEIIIDLVDLCDKIKVYNKIETEVYS